MRRRAGKGELRALLDERRTLIGTFTALADPVAIELVALAGFDYTLIDMEHSTLTLDAVQTLLRAAASRGLPCIVRLPDGDPTLTMQVLDAGADGVLIPHVKNAQGASAAVRAAKYPPLGDRGFFDGSRAADYFAHGLTDQEWASVANRAVVVGVLVEDPVAIDQVDAIAETAGLDFIMFGPGDLAAQLSLYDSRDNPQVIDAARRVREACRRAGITFSMRLNHRNCRFGLDELKSDAGSLLFVGSDVGTLISGLRSIRTSIPV